VNETAPRHRRLHLFAGGGEASVDRVRRLLPESDDVPWIGPAAARRPRAADLLGRDLAGLVVDARETLDADRFGAAAGAVRAGGPVILLLPDTPPASPFLARCLRLIHARDDLVLRPVAEAPAGPLPLPPPAAEDFELGTDQRAAVDAVRRALTGRARRPVVLRADRGRGKSTALGEAAAEALAAQDGTIVVTAPRAGSVQTLLARGRRRAAELGVDPDRLRWLPVDRVLDAAPHARGLLVDEAAAIPVERLGAWLDAFGRIAFATTVHGYEGTGRGFDVRFRARLDARTPEWRERTLVQPVRYDADDPLEALQFSLLALDAEPPPEPGADEAPQLVPTAELAADETALRALFGLLVQAHYRTRPSDLARLLDDPALRVWRSGPARAPAGCALTIDEGGLDAAVATAIRRGERRPVGQQGPGVFAAHLGLEAGARLPSRRVTRIAVHPAARRRGLGRALVTALADEARRTGVSALTSHFGATPELLAFWRACDLEALRLGLTREAASGEHAAFVGVGLDGSGEALVASARRQFVADLGDQLADPLADLDPVLALALLRGAPAEALMPDDLTVARRWLRGEIPLEERPGALRRVLRARLAGNVDEDALAALVARLVQRRSWDEVAARLGAGDRGDAEARLRTALAGLLGDD
jgi:tRNA(Met) cytidine acetyltransferase